MSKSKQLATNKDYKNVFIRPDRTPAEQEIFNALNTEKNKLNNGLRTNNKLDQPFRFVIRSDKVRAIDVSQQVEINGKNKHPFAKWKDALEAAKYVVHA